MRPARTRLRSPACYIAVYAGAHFSQKASGDKQAAEEATSRAGERSTGGAGRLLQWMLPPLNPVQFILPRSTRALLAFALTDFPAASRSSKVRAFQESHEETFKLLRDKARQEQIELCAGEMATEMVAEMATEMAAETASQVRQTRLASLDNLTLARAFECIPLL